VYPKDAAAKATLCAANRVTMAHQSAGRCSRLELSCKPIIVDIYSAKRAVTAEKSRPRGKPRFFERVAVLAAGMALAACSTQNSRPPAITRRATHESHPGKVVWLDLVTSNVAGAELFYGKLFGWTFLADPNDAGYVTVHLRDHLIGGMVKPPLAADANHQPAWLTYLAVRDVDAAAVAALRRGGKVLAAPRTYPGRGRQAVLQDPDGAVFAIITSATGDPPDRLIEPDRWIWSTVLAHDVAAESRFYEETVGYKIVQLPPDHGLHQVVLQSGDYARATLNESAHDPSAARPRWINFVRVEDVIDTVNKATALGGRTLVSPHIDRHGGRVAVMADPQGVWFGVMEWPDGGRPETAK
jgi:predicted enzyme related to lactoylglutathione lyase